MAKIEGDKYYTSSYLAKYVVDKAKEIIGSENIIEYIEPSAGGGVFLDFLDKPFVAYDIEPRDKRVVEQDFLKVDLVYKEGRCVIGNPPFGRANCHLKKFYKKCVGICDYIVFIMPISQYENDYELYDYDLVYSEDLGIHEYSGIRKHCCLNIFIKPKIKKKKPQHKYKDIENIGWRKAKETECDFYICCYGSSIGKFVDKDSELVNINGLIIHNEKIKDKVVQAFEDVDWCKEYAMTSSPNLTQWQIFKYLKEQIPELK